jgi:hypothetical protein
MLPSYLLLLLKRMLVCKLLVDSSVGMDCMDIVSTQYGTRRVLGAVPEKYSTLTHVTFTTNITFIHLPYPLLYTLSKHHKQIWLPYLVSFR